MKESDQTFQPIHARLISIIVPFYKHGEFLAEAMRSIEEQDYSLKEIILVDDGSPVHAENFLTDTSGMRIIRTENEGVSAARNIGFRESLGSYILFLDADDRLPPGAISAHMRAMDAHPGAALTFGARRTIDDEGRVLVDTHVCRPRRNYFRMFLESNPIGGPGSCLIRRDMLEKTGGFRKGKAMAEDYELWLRIAQIGPIIRHDVCVLEYRVHSNNVSQQNEPMLAGTLDTLDRIAPTLEPKDRARLEWGKRRWIHEYRPRQDPLYKLEGLFYSMRAMLGVPLSALWQEILGVLGLVRRRTFSSSR